MMAMVAGCSCALAFGFSNVSVVETLWPLEPNEATGAQLGRGIAALFLMMVGFVFGCAVVAKGVPPYQDAFEGVPEQVEEIAATPCYTC